MLTHWVRQWITRRHTPRAPITRRRRPILGSSPHLLEDRLAPAAVRPGFDANSLFRNDDSSTGQLNIGFNANFFGNTYSQLYANNNGNLTFNFPLGTFTPFGLTGSLGTPIIAPFFADVDTRPVASGVLQYGTGTVDGRQAFGATWRGVGYYNLHVDKLNTFQVILINRGDTGPGNFDIEFNYDQIKWETGDASNGSNGFGGSSARAGFSNGTGRPGTFHEFPGSGVHGGFLDGNAATGLRNNSNVGVAGRYLFGAREGTVPVNQPPVLAPIGNKVINEGEQLAFTASAADPDAGNSIAYSLVGAPAGAAIHPATGAFTWTPTEAQGPGNYTFTVRATDNGSPARSDEETITVTVNEVNSGPVLNPIPDQTVNEGSAVTFTATATDSDIPPNVLTFSLVSPPATASIHPTTGQFSWTPPDDGTYTVTVQVTDSGNPSLSNARTVTIRANNVAPTPAINGAPATSPEGTVIDLTSTVTDPGADTFTYSWGVTKNGNPYAGGPGSAFSFKPDDDGTYVASLTVTDDDGGASTVAKTIVVTNVAPAAQITGAPATSPEGTEVALGSSVDDPGTADTHSYSWSVTRDGQAFATGTGPALAFTPTDNGEYVVSLTVTDDDGGAITTSKSIAVTNVAPTANAGVDQTVNEGDTVNLSGTFTDPGSADTHTQAWSVAASNGQVIADGSGASFSFVPNDNGTYTVTYKVTDDDLGVGTDTAVVTVNNVNPAVGITGAPASSPEGILISLGSTPVSDPGSADTHTLAWVVTKNGNPYASGGGSGISFTPDDNGSYVVSLTATDDDGGTGSDSKTITVTNLAPTVTPITAPADPVPAGTGVQVSSSFSDPGAGDSHTVLWSWGDGSSTTVNVPAGGSTALSAEHPYSPGVYTVTLTVTDDDGASATTSYQYVVVYDPSAGFVTGGGWIDSPAGAYTADPSLTGRANFGFVSKYKNGTTIPDGNTQFQFKVANFDFKSTGYDWLVVAGDKAKYKGTGTVNGVSGYKFQLTAVDGHRNGSGVDKFRIKIWNDAGVVYDNQMGSSDDGFDATALAGGSIQIHG